MANEIQIRGARGEDLAAVRALLSAAALPLAGVPADLRGFLVAESGGTVVGAIGLEDYGEHGLLRSAVVAPAWQGRGVGGRLTAALLGAARRDRRSALFLLTTTAAGYFPRLGFRAVPREEVPAAVQNSVEFRHACPTTAVAMRLDLE